MAVQFKPSSLRWPRWPTWGNLLTDPNGSGGGGPTKLTTGTNYYVSPSGNDSNAGTASGSPWRTDGKIRTMVGNGTIKTGVFFYTATGQAVPYLTLDELGQKGVADAMIAGTISHSGDIINLLGVIPITGAFAGASAIGARVLNFGSAGGFDNSRTLASSGWTNPSGGIWKLAAGATTYYRGVVLEAGALMTPVQGANFAAATAALGTAGTFFPDPATGDLYVHPTAGGSPNSNGITYLQCQSWFATDTPLVDMSGGWATADVGHVGTIKYVATYDTTTLRPISLNIGQGDGSKMTFIQRIAVYFPGKHAIELACGNGVSALQQTGMFVCDGCRVFNSPTNFSSGDYTDYVAFIDGPGSGTFYVRYNDCQDHLGGWTSHNNSGTNQIRRIEFTTCTINGGGGLGASECNHSTITSCTINGGVSMNATGSTVATGNTFNYRLPDLGNGGNAVGTITLTGNTFVPGNVFSGACAIGGSGGTVTIVGSGNTFTMSGGTGNSAQWIRGGVFHLTLGDTINAQTVAPLLSAITPASGDTVTLAGSNVYIASGSQTTAPLAAAYAGGGALTWNTSSANGSAGVTWSGGSTLFGAPVGTGNPANLYSGIVHGVKSGVQDTITTDPVDLTGKNFSAISLTFRQGVTMTVSDNNGNVFTARTLKSGVGNLGSTIAERIYDCLAFVGKAGHTFTAAGANSWPTIKYIAAVKAGTPLFDQESGVNGSATQESPGSKTPAVAGSLVFTGASVDFDTSATLTVDSGYTRTDIYTTGNGFGGAAATMTAGNIAITAPNWTGSVLVTASVMAIYK